MATLVSGNPGAGKSTLTAELVRRGVLALDADHIDGLAAWRNAAGDVVGDDTLPTTPELLASCYWGWSTSRLDDVVEELGPEGILLGIAVNQWDFVDRFETLVLLELDPITQRERVSERDALAQEQIFAGLPVLQRHLISLGAARIDATQPTSVVADQVLALLAARQDPAR